MTSPGLSPDTRLRGSLDRLLGLFSDVRAGEGGRALLMLANIFLILVCYYIIKTVREPLILNAQVSDLLQQLGIRGTAELKSYAAAAQALMLIAFVPAYSWFASRVDRSRLIFGVTLFFVVNVELFALAVGAGVPLVGVAFYIWVGLFNLSIIAQFWSYANDIYTKNAGDRLFPIIGVGMTAGSPVGAALAERMFSAGLAVPTMLHLGAALLLVSLVLYYFVNRQGQDGSPSATAARPAEPLAAGDGFALVLRSPYIRLIALLIVVLNVVNTTGEYILSSFVVSRADQLAAANPAFDKDAFIGSFYGGYLFAVSVIAVLLQAFVVSRLVRYLGLAGVLLALPLTSLAAYGFIALGATLSVVRWAKTAENSTDYSVMNTARQLLWLPTSRAEKYKAKQAVDTFFVRFGDVLSALVVFVGTTWLALQAQGFALFNLALVVVWLALAVALVRRNRRLVAASQESSA